MGEEQYLFHHKPKTLLNIVKNELETKINYQLRQEKTNLDLDGEQCHGGAKLD